MVYKPTIGQPFLYTASHVLANKSIDNRPYVVALSNLRHVAEFSVKTERDLVARGRLDISEQLIAAVRNTFEQHRMKIVIAPHKFHTVCRELSEIRPPSVA